MKKITVVVGGFVLLVGIFLGTLYTPIVQAATTQTFSALKSIGILGVGVVQSDSYQFGLIDMSDSTSSIHFILPTVEGNTGLIYTVKRTGSTPYDHFGLVNVQEGEAIDGSEDAEWGLWQAGDYVTLIADEENETWWIIGRGSTN